MQPTAQATPTQANQLTTQPYQPAMRLVSNKEIDARREAERRQNQPQIIGLAAYLKTQWEQAHTAKQQIQVEILRDYQARNGQYSEAKLAQIREFGGSEIYMLLINQKCRSVEAYLSEVLSPSDDKPWGLDPSPIPDLPPDVQEQVVQQVFAESMAIMQASGINGVGGVMPSEDAMLNRASQLNDQAKQRLDEEAKLRAGKMEEKIEDQLAEGKWDIALNEFIHDLATTKAAILKGPIVRKRKALKWVQANGKYSADVHDTYKMEWERRSPLDIYPSADATDIQDGYLFDRHQLSLTDLNSMRGLHGVDDATVDMVIEQYGRSGRKSPETGDQQRAEIEQRRYAYWAGYSTTIEALEYWGSVPGFLLKEWGIQVPDDQKYQVFHVNAWLIGNYVIKVTINEDPLGLRPYSKTSFEKLPGSFWGRGPAELISDYQDMCNACARALVNNMGMASGPMGSINDTSRIPPGEDVTNLHPWKLFQFGPDKGSQSYRPPIEWFQPNSNAEVLMGVYDHFAQLADNVLGVPAYPMGELQGAAQSTASGMSMALTQATRGMKRVFRNADIDVINPAITRMYNFNMMYNPDESIKFDLVCVPRGSSAMLTKEHDKIRKQEFLDRTANPVDMQILGLEGRANLLREVAKTLDMPVEKVIPKDEQELANFLMQQQSGQAPTPQTLDAAGQPVSGQDQSLFSQ